MTLCKYVFISVFVSSLAVRQCVSVMYWRIVKEEQNTTDAVARCVPREFRGQVTVMWCMTFTRLL